MLTIGKSARAARLSPKALRLYDELGLLTRPGWTRSRATGSTNRASWSGPGWWPGRALGMPLARIRVVCAPAPGSRGRRGRWRSRA